MAHVYGHLSAERQEQIKADTVAEKKVVITEALLSAWEADHLAHATLYDAAVAAGDTEAAEAHAAAMATIEAAHAKACPPPA